MVVRYSQMFKLLWTAFALLQFGVFLYQMDLLRNSSGGMFFLRFFLVAAIGLAVISFWVRPFMQVGKREVVIESAFGVIKRRFPYDKLRIEEGGRLVAEKGADWKYLPVPRWVCHPDDWAQLVQRYGES